MDSVIGRVIASLLVLGLLAGVGTLARQGMAAHRTAQTATDIRLIAHVLDTRYASVTNTQNLGYLPAADFSDLSGLWGTQAPGAATLNTTGTLVEAWGNALQIVGYADPALALNYPGVSLAANQFAVADLGTSLPRAGCQQIVQALGSSLYAVYAGQGGVFSVIGVPGSTPTPAQIAVGCAAADTELVFVFNLT